jgi:hypothetical protein
MDGAEKVISIVIIALFSAFIAGIYFGYAAQIEREKTIQKLQHDGCTVIVLD